MNKDKQAIEGPRRAHLAKAQLCLGYLYVNNLITMKERFTIGNRLNRYQDKYKVEITEAQLNSAKLTYDDDAEGEKGDEE